jgi:hypothetical protein
MAMATVALPSSAAAGTVLCPDPLEAGQNRQYSLTTEPDSVCFAYGTGNLNGAGNDAFLELHPELNFVGDNDAFDAGTDFTGTEGDFFFTGDAGTQYYLGMKDGGDPKWAVFALPLGVFSGSWGFESTGGSLSHLALYSGEPDGPEPIGSNLPEPTSLVLLGAGLAAAGARLRRRVRA